MGLAQRESGTRLVAGDWICEHLAVYEYGGLLDVMAASAGEGLRDRCDQLAGRSPGAMRGSTLDDVDDRRRVTELVDGEGVGVLNLGALVECGRGSPDRRRRSPSADPHDILPVITGCGAPGGNRSEGLLPV